MESNYDKLIEDLHDIEKTMFALGTSPMNMDNVSIRLAYDKRWGRTAADAADAIEELNKNWKYCSDMLNLALKVSGLSMTALVKLYETEVHE